MLDAASLEAITLEARQCFLTEDAPDYLLLLHQGIESLTQAKKEKLTPAANIYQNLIRAAHSLKGGAGIAQLPQLQQLAHRLEDLLQAMAGGQIADLSLAIELITLSIESINQLIEVAKNGTEEAVVNSKEIIKILEEFLNNLEKDQKINKELKPSPRLTQLIPQESPTVVLNTIEQTQIGEPNLIQEYLQVELSFKNSQQNTLNLAIPLEKVEEVITKKKSEICPIPEVDSAIYGVINYRGKLLWVLGLVDLLNLNQPRYIQPHKKMILVVIKRETQKIGCFVSSLKEIISLNSQQLSLTNGNKYLKAETQGMAILDVNAVFDCL